jgi:hypothetical protein
MSQLFAVHQAKMNEPNPLLTVVPSSLDAIEMAKFAKPQQETAQSSFAGLPDVPRRGRPPGSKNAPKETPEGPEAA